jgi:hypothetical protein
MDCGRAASPVVPFLIRMPLAERGGSVDAMTKPILKDGVTRHLPPKSTHSNHASWFTEAPLPRTATCYPKAVVIFSDAIAAARREIGTVRVFTSGEPRKFRTVFGAK